MIGTKLGNRYELVEKIGEGGMAIVYKAKCNILNRFVAVKILKPEYSSNVDFMEKFRREALATASFSHNNIVSIYDVGSEGNINYIVMELVSGKTLKEYIREYAPLSTDTTLKISIQIAKALECAHKNKIIHRDIKPHNILITEDEVIKVTDFGIAKAASSDTITHTNKVIGSAHYFSPEQAKGKIVDNRTDIYSFGIVVYEMVTGRVPFDGESAVTVALKHIQDDMIQPKALVPTVPNSLNNLILKATQKEVIKRYNNITEMLVDLIRIDNNNMYAVTPSNMDNEFTTVMDTIQIENTVYTSHATKKLMEDDIEDDEEEEDDYDEKRNKKRKISTWKKVLIGAGSILFLIILGVFVGNLVYNLGNENTAKYEIKVPKIIGLTVEEAQTEVEKLDLTFTILGEEASEKPEGTIFVVFPTEGTSVKKGSEVKVRVSTGPGELTVPEVATLGRNVAEQYIVTQGLKVGTVSEDYSDKIPEGAVISTNPAANTKVKKGDTIDIVISKGLEVKMTKVPNLSGISIQDAEQVLVVSKLKLGAKTPASTDDKSKDGIIFNQSDAAGTEVEVDRTINVNYYEYKEPEVVKIQVPRFIGMTIEEAKAGAQSIGLILNITGDSTGFIIDQDQKEGKKVEKGTTINLTAQVKEPVGDDGNAGIKAP